MTVVYIRPSRSKGYVSIGISNDDEKQSFTVSEEIYSEIGSPAIGDLVGRDEYSLICSDDELYRARIKALRILSFADNSRAALKRKLVSAGFSREVSEAVTEEMVSLGYINERRRLESLIKDEANINLIGPRKIIPKLVAKGYSYNDIEEVISSLSELGEIDFDASRSRLIKKKLGEHPEREEVKRLLYKSGYEVCSEDF